MRTKESHVYVYYTCVHTFNPTQTESIKLDVSHCTDVIYRFPSPANYTSSHLVVMQEPRDGHFRDERSQSRDKKVKRERKRVSVGGEQERGREGGRLSVTKGGEECPRRERREATGSSPSNRPRPILGCRCDDCCVSLHRSGHPVDPGVG